MSDVFREVTFRFDGRDVRVTPSLGLLRRIKGRGINNVQLANACVRGGVDLEDLAAAHSAFMAAAGDPVTEEESYLWLSQGGAEVASFQMAYVQSVLPGVDLGKKPAPRAAKGKKKTNPKT